MKTSFKHLACAVALSLGAAACTAPADELPGRGTFTATPPSGPLAPGLVAALESLFDEPRFLTQGDAEQVARFADGRAAWPLVDLLRFHQLGPRDDEIRAALRSLTGVRAEGTAWVAYSNLLLERDVPAPPGYLELKRKAFVAHGEGWAAFFDDDSPLDWRTVSWGGVPKDGIPSLDDPPVTDARAGRWLPDDDVVFGVVVGDAARAYPRRMMEVHEMVNDTLGGRRIALPYCTLCGVAAGYFTDRVPRLPTGVKTPLTLKTSGLLQRSNKLMYDAGTDSLFDQFGGEAVAGRLLDANVVLPRLPVVTTTWGEWRAANPGTTILAQDGGTGRGYVPNPLGDRDAEGPIFPVGEVDPRMEAQVVVYGVSSGSNRPVAFHAAEAQAELRAGRPVTLAGVGLGLKAGGLVVQHPPNARGDVAFWFAWSQFNKGTLLWRKGR